MNIFSFSSCLLFPFFLFRLFLFVVRLAVGCTRRTPKPTKYLLLSYNETKVHTQNEGGWMRKEGTKARVERDRVRSMRVRLGCRCWCPPSRASPRATSDIRSLSTQTTPETTTHNQPQPSFALFTPLLFQSFPPYLVFL